MTEDKQVEIPGYSAQRQAEFHEIGRQAFADGALEENARRRAAGLKEPELSREDALRIADGWLRVITPGVASRDVVEHSDYDDSELALGKQRIAQLERLEKHERALALPAKEELRWIDDL